MKLTKDSWIGFDLDGTIAEHDLDKDYDPEVIGNPIPNMIAKLKGYLDNGIKCKIITARVEGIWHNRFSDKYNQAYSSFDAIENWLIRYLGYKIPITSSKDEDMLFFYDDRCVQVEMDTGRIIGKEFEI